MGILKERIKIGITFIFRFYRRPIQIVVFNRTTVKPENKGNSNSDSN